MKARKKTPGPAVEWLLKYSKKAQQELRSLKRAYPHLRFNEDLPVVDGKRLRAMTPEERERHLLKIVRFQDRHFNKLVVIDGE